MKVRYKVWFESDDGKYVLGPGGYKILKLLETEESLLGVSRKLKISYRHLWGIVKEMEKNLGEKIVHTTRSGGIRTKLTARGRELLERYENIVKVFDHYLRRPYVGPAISVDGVLIENRRVLLVRRGREPFKGMYALPGGFVEYGESVEEAIVREVLEETGLRVVPKRLVGVYSDKDRDPRGHTISVAFLLERIEGNIRSGDDAYEALFFPIDELPPLAFDHKKIIEDSLGLLSLR